MGDAGRGESDFKARGRQQAGTALSAASLSRVAVELLPCECSVRYSVEGRPPYPTRLAKSFASSLIHCYS